MVHINIDNWNKTRLVDDGEEWADTEIMDRSSNPITQTITQRTSQVAKNRVLDILDSQKISSEDIVIPEKISRLFFDPQFSNITPFLKYIIQQGTVNAIREDSTALEVALYHGYLPVVDFLLLFPEILINRGDFIGSTPLEKAFLGGYPASISRILKDERLDILAHNHGEKILKNKDKPYGKKVDDKYYKQIEILIRKALKKKEKDEKKTRKMKSYFGF